MSDLLTLLARAFDTKGYPDDKNPDNWRKINGAPVHLDNNGNIDGGAGGKFSGKQWSSTKHPHKPKAVTNADLKKAWSRVGKYQVAIKRVKNPSIRKVHAQNMLDVIQEYEDMKAKADPSVQKSHNPNIAKAKGFAKAVLAGQNSQAAQAPKASTQKTNTVQWFIGQYQQLQKAMKNFTAKPNAADKNTILRLLNDVSANNYDKFSLNEKKQIWKAAGSKSAYMNDVNQANGIVALQGLASVGQGTSRNPFPVFDATRKAAVKVFKTAKDADSVLRTNLEKVWAAATTAEREAAFIYSYSFSQFQESMRFGCYGYGSGRLVPLNRVDWDNLGVGTMGKKRGEVKNNIKNLTSMIDKSSCPHDVRLERGTRLDGIAALFGVSISKLQSGDTNTLNAMLVGKVGKDEGFTSCGSSTGSGFSSYPAILHIDCPAGTKMLYMEPFAAYGGDAPYDAAAMYNTSRKPWSYWDGKSKQKKFGDQDETLIQRGTKYCCTKAERVNGQVHIYMQVLSQDPYPIP